MNAQRTAAVSGPANAALMRAPAVSSAVSRWKCAARPANMTPSASIVSTK